MAKTIKVVTPDNLSDIYFDKGVNTPNKIEYKFQYSIASLKTASNTPPIVFINNDTKEGLFEYVAGDTSTGDDVDIIVTNSGKRYKRRTSTTNEVANKLDKGYSLTELRNLSNSKVNTISLFYCSESGKEGFWRKYTGNTSGLVDNTGTLIQTTGGLWLERIIIDGCIYPEWFGAKGDGINNDTVSIQQALDYSETKKLTLKFGNKRYVTSYTLLYGSNINIIGDHTIINCINTNIGAVFACKSFKSDWYSTYGSTTNVEISGFEFDVTGEVAGIGINRGNHITVKKCISRNMDSHLVDITGKHILITECQAYGSIDPNAPYQIDNLEIGNGNPQWITIEDGSSLAITNDGFQSEDVKIINNYAEGCYHAVHLHRQNLGIKSNILITQNTFVDCEIPIYQDPSKTWDTVSIIDNIITSSIPRFRAMYLNGINKNLTIDNNKIYNYVNVIFHDNVSSLLEDFTFSNNNCYAQNSSLSNSDRRAINIQRNITNAKIVNNYFDNFDRAINSNSTAVVSNIKISDNIFKNSKQRAIGLDKTVGGIIENNLIDIVNSGYTGFTSTSWRTYSQDFGIAGIVINDSSYINIKENTFKNVNTICVGINSIIADNISITNNTAIDSIAFLTTKTSTTTKSTNIYVNDNIAYSKTNSILGGVYIIDITNLEINNNMFSQILHNGLDVRKTDNITIKNNTIKAGFDNTAIDKKGIVFTTCSNIKCDNNTQYGYNITNNYEYYIAGVSNSVLNISKYIGWVSPETSSNCRINFSSNTIPQGSQVGKYAVGSIVTNDNNTGGVPNGEPIGWICTVESNSSTFIPYGQLGFRNLSGNPNTNLVTPQYNGEIIFDSLFNRYFQAFAISTPTSTSDSWVLINNSFQTTSFVNDIPSIPSLGYYFVDVNMSKIAINDFIVCSSNGVIGDLIITGTVKTEDTGSGGVVRVKFFNPTASPIDNNNATYYIRAYKY